MTDSFQKLKPSFILFSPSVKHLAAAIHSRSSFPISKMFAFDDSLNISTEEKPVIEGSRFWHELLDFEGGKTFNWRRTQSENSTVTLTYTSGTTGPKKLVELTHKNHLAGMELQILDYEIWQSQETKARCYHEPSDVVEKQPMVILAFYELSGTAGMRILRTLRQAALGYPVRCFIMPHGYSNLDRVFEILSSQRITHILSPTDFLFRVVDYVCRKSNQKWPQYNFSHLSSVVMSGAPCGRTMISSSLEFFRQCGAGKDMVILNRWGLSEASGVITSPKSTTSSLELPDHSVGKFITCMEGKIVPIDDDQKRQSDNVGEVWVRGPMIMKGYWRQEEVTRDTITADGWLKTGDIGTIDDQNNLVIHGRKKEVFKMNGMQINPAELEAALLNHPSIHDAAVIGVKKAGPGAGEVPRAFIKTFDPTLTCRDVDAFMKREVHAGKELGGGIFFLKELPKSSPVSISFPSSQPCLIQVTPRWGKRQNQSWLSWILKICQLLPRVSSRSSQIRALELTVNKLDFGGANINLKERISNCTPVSIFLYNDSKNLETESSCLIQ